MSIKTLEITFTAGEVVQILTARAVEDAGPGWRPRWTQPENNVVFRVEHEAVTIRSVAVVLEPQPFEDMPTMEGAQDPLDDPPTDPPV